MSKKIIVSLIFLIVILTSCSQAPPSSLDVTDDATTVQGESGQYSTVIPYGNSAIRGIQNPDTNVSLNIDEMEVGLMDISKEFASPDKYLYVPGQVITEQEVFYLLQRELDDDQYNDQLTVNDEALNIGLNPILKDGDDPKDSKVYVSNIIEQDYVKQTDPDQVQMIALGVGIDSTYEYIDQKGRNQTIQISDEELITYAFNDIATKLITFIHSKEGYQDTNILIGFYKHSEDDLNTGKYMAYTYIDDSDQKIELVEVKEEYILFPSDQGAEYDSAINEQLIQLNSQLLKYFNDYAGLSGSGFYDDNQLQELTIKINANFYSTVDVQVFTNYVASELQQTMKTDADIIVEINQTNGEAVSLIEIPKNDQAKIFIY